MASDSSKRPPLLDRLFAHIDALLPSDRFLLLVLLTVALGSMTIGALSYSQAQTVTVPTRGGSLHEGIVGTPRFVNPVLAMTRADSDMTALIYSGLMRLAPDGSLKPDLAESITISDDGLVYNVVLRSDVTFHDGTPIDSADVAYTIGAIQNQALKSPLRGNWSGVTVEVIGDRELNFILEDPYAPFLQNLTVGILPRHIWEPVKDENFTLSQHNTIPVGSGPYQIDSVMRDRAGLIDGYTLTPHSTDGRTEPQIKQIDITFFANEIEVRNALESGAITSTTDLSRDSIDTLRAQGGYTVVTETLPRTTAIFFNQNDSPALRDAAVRAALAASIDRDALIDAGLAGYGTPAATPVPQEFAPAAFDEMGAQGSTSTQATVQTILTDGGWVMREGEWQKEIDGDAVPLTFSLATANDAPFTDIARELRDTWTELGITVTVDLYEQSDLIQQVVRPRDFDALLFGTEVGRALDLYPFWHSSQREDPGLNITRYANITTDAALETLRSSRDATERTEALETVVTTLAEEEPAIFLYNPVFTYVLTDTVRPTAMNGIARTSERFSNIRNWHVRADEVWPFFADTQFNQ